MQNSGENKPNIAVTRQDMATLRLSQLPMSSFGLLAVAGNARSSDGRRCVGGEQLGNLILDAGDDLGIEQRHHRSDEDGAEDNSDDDLDPLADIKITALVGDDGLHGIGNGMDCVGNLLKHGLFLSAALPL